MLWASVLWVTETDFQNIEYVQEKQKKALVRVKPTYTTTSALPRPWSIAATVALLPVAESLCVKRLVEKLS